MINCGHCAEVRETLFWAVSICLDFEEFGVLRIVRGFEMGDRELVYSLVARGTAVVAQYSAYTGNFGAIASQCLEKLPAGDGKHTYVCDGHTFNFLVDGGVTYLVVAGEGVGRQIPFAFLERVRADFSAGAGAEFAPRLQEHMAFVAAHPDEVARVSKIQAQVAEVKGVMMENIEKVLDRTERIDLLVGKGAGLESHALQFEKQGAQIRRCNCCANLKIKLLVLALLTIVVCVIYLSICRGFACHDPGLPGTPSAGTPPAER